MTKSELITKYKHTLTLKNYSPRTISAYLNGLGIFLEYVSSNRIKKIDSATLEKFFFHAKSDVGYGYSSMKQLLASVKFLYKEVLQEDTDFDFNIKMKKPTKIPEVLSIEEVERFLNSFTNIKHKALFTLCYSAGLRLGEILGIKISDIDSDRMQIRIAQSKGKKDRYSLLSPKVLVLLRTYVKVHQPKEYLFEG